MNDLYVVSPGTSRWPEEAHWEILNLVINSSRCGMKILFTRPETTAPLTEPERIYPVE